MSQFYSGVTAQLMAWALGAKPADVVLKYAVVNDSYDFNAAHTRDQLTGVLKDGELAGTLEGSTVKVGELQLLGLTPGDVMQAIVFYFSWTGGSKLIAFVNQTAFADLPFIIPAPELLLRFSPNGVFRI